MIVDDKQGQLCQLQEKIRKRKEREWRRDQMEKAHMNAPSMGNIGTPRLHSNRGLLLAETIDIASRHRYFFMLILRSGLLKLYEASLRAQRGIPRKISSTVTDENSKARCSR